MSETGAINRDAVHQKHGSLQGPDTGRPHDAAAVEGILARRADELARRRQAVARDETARPVLLIRVGAFLAGVAVEDVREIVRMKNYAPVPEAHEWLLGVINAHNDLFSLVDTRLLLNLPAAEPPAFSYALLLRHDRLRVAIGCHQVVQLREIPESQWQEDRLFHAGDEVGVLLDPAKLLAPWEHELDFNTQPDETKK